MQIIDGKKIRAGILKNIRQEVTRLSFKPVFSDVLVGEEPASVQYVRMKAKTAEASGIAFHQADFPESITTDELILQIKKLNEVKNMCGIIVQLPLPQHIERQKVFDAIDPDLDVDCLGRLASERFYKGDTNIGFPTALSCMALLDSLDLDLKNKKIAVVGQGMLVGRPVTALLQFRGLSPATIDINTPEEEKKHLIKEADIIISGTGQGKFLTGDMVKEGVVMIDAGTSESNGGIVGDVDLESVKDAASYVSPVPGGVGPVTVAMLLRNVLTVAKKK
jgi:methylenetetrahydrofolate dehydrogenase (NADP+) / methenyltetrahydrofolate cyclohydrolase